MDSLFPRLAQQFALTCGLCSFYYMTTLGQGEPIRYFPLVLLPYSLSVYAINYLFLRQSRTMRSIVLLNAAFFAALFASVLLIGGIADWATLVFQGGFCLWITVWGARCCLEPPELRSLIVSLDLNVLLLLIFTALLAGMGQPILWCAPTAAGCAASILGLIAQRANRPLGLKDWGILLFVFSGLSAVMWLLVVWAAAPAGQGLVALWNALTAAVRWLALKLWALILFLLSLFPDAEPGDMSFIEPVMPVPAEEMMPAETSPVFLIFLITVLAAAVIVALILLLRQLGRLRAGGSQIQTASRHRTGRISFWHSMKRMWAALAARLRLWIFLRRIRNTPEGLFHLLVRRCQLSPWRKRTGETPREFLTRLRETATGDRELFDALSGLIPAVDAALYSPCPDRQVYPNAKLIRRRIGSASRRYQLLQAWKHLRAVLTRWHIFPERNDSS